MPSLKKRLDKLSAAPPVAQTAILRAALQHANPDEQGPIAQRLITLGCSRGVAAAIRLTDRHPELMDSLLHCDRRALTDAIGQIVAAGHQRSLLRSIDIAEQRTDPALFAPLIPVLGRHDHHCDHAIGAALLNTTLHHIGRTGRRATPPNTRAQLDQLLATALRSVDQHRNTDVVLAAAVMHLGAGKQLASVFNEHATPARLTVQGVPRRIDHPIVIRNLLNWLDSELLGRQAARALHEVDQQHAVELLLDTTHLLLAPRRRRMMRSVDRVARCLYDLQVVTQLQEQSQRMLPRFVASLPITTARRVAYLSDLIAAPSPNARWRAVELLAGHRTVDAQTAADRFSRDQHPVIASVAASRTLRGGWAADGAQLQVIHRGAHQAQSHRASLFLAGQDAAHFAALASTLQRPALLTAAHRVARNQPQELQRQLEIMLQHHDRRDVCLTGIFLIRRLQWSSSCVDALHECATADDAQICSAAVAALAETSSDDLFELVRPFARHKHTRVRANAIDALSQISRRARDEQPDRMIEVITPHILSRHNRERANALRAWIRHGADAPEPSDRNRGIDGLRDMLHDPNPMHQISAIWVAGRSRLPMFAGDLRSAAHHDSAPPVRRRAVAALRRLRSEPVEVAA